MLKNTAGQVIGVQMVTASDGSAFTGAVTVYVTKDGGTQAIGGATSPEGSCVHEGNGFHTYTPTQDETNAAHAAFTFIGTGAIPATVQAYPISFDEIADALLKRDWTAVDTASPSDVAARSVLNALRILRNKWEASGGTLTVRKEDDVTAAWTSTLTTDGAANPITASDPD